MKKTTQLPYPETAIPEIIQILNKSLANTYLLAIKTKNFHWNVKGINFQQLHLLFDTQNAALLVNADLIAERARAFDNPVIGTMTDFLKAATLQEEPATYPDAHTMLATLLANHEHIINGLYSDIEKLTQLTDVGTADIFTGLLADHEKMAWMLRVHIQ